MADERETALKLQTEEEEEEDHGHCSDCENDEHLFGDGDKSPGDDSGAKKKKKKQKRKKDKAGGKEPGQEPGKVNSLPAEKLQEIQKAIELFSVGQGPAKTMEEASRRSYQFWDTQPVPKLGEGSCLPRCSHTSTLPSTLQPHKHATFHAAATQARYLPRCSHTSTLPSTLQPHKHATFHAAAVASTTTFHTAATSTLPSILQPHKHTTFHTAATQAHYLPRCRTHATFHAAATQAHYLPHCSHTSTLPSTLQNCSHESYPCPPPVLLLSPPAPVPLPVLPLQSPAPAPPVLTPCPPPVLSPSRWSGSSAPPGWLPQWHCGVRVLSNSKLVGFISAIPADIRIYDTEKRMVEINFLCVHKKLRSKRVAPVLIREITRRVNLQGIFQAVYTAGVVLPKPVSTCRYWHRSLNPRKLIEVKFSHLSRNMTMQRTMKLYRLPEAPKNSGLRPMQRKDVPAVHRLLQGSLQQFHLTPAMSPDEVEHWLLPRENIIDTYVVENPEGSITDFLSFYTLPSSIMNHPVHKSLKAAYSFYNVHTTTSLLELMSDALPWPVLKGFDVFNALDLMENKTFLEKLKFGIGDGNLQYYLYNWKCPSMGSEKVRALTGS
ncbi:glycylpeptide N-tetradecanoyltransferase 1-like [Huso huso]|uniref:Glycylpeptide N-tetradecanoyltransferase n=1 Tax=Huso huso TaxID=61971 RepID=A0ABR0YCG4_HUSHU